MFGWNHPEVIQFKCHPDTYGHIPEPYPARKFMPEWYKKLAMFHYRPQDNGALSRAGTIKRCPPVLDALGAGWVIPLAADVEFTLRDDGAGMSWVCGDGQDPGFIAQAHRAEQLEGHPRHPRVPIKFINHWQIKTPPGWSVQLEYSPV